MLFYFWDMFYLTRLSNWILYWQMTNNQSLRDGDVYFVVAYNSRCSSWCNTFLSVHVNSSSFFSFSQSLLLMIYDHSFCLRSGCEWFQQSKFMLCYSCIFCRLHCRSISNLLRSAMNNYKGNWGQNYWWTFWTPVQINVETVSLENTRPTWHIK